MKVITTALRRYVRYYCPGPILQGRRAREDPEGGGLCLKSPQVIMA